MDRAELEAQETRAGRAGRAAQEPGAPPRLGALRLARDATLRSYGQILFSGALPVGFILLLATAIDPALCAAGLASVLLATGVARLVGFGEESIRSGLFGYNALLVGLGAQALLPPTLVSLGLAVVAVVAAVLATSALHSALGQSFGLPVLTLPFLFVFYLLLGAAPLLGQDIALEGSAALFDEAALPGGLRHYLRSLGAIFFLPRADAGLVVFAALLVYSRIGVMLSLLGFAIAWGLGLPLLGVSDGFLALVVGYNFVLVAIAIGGVWFVPSLSSLALAATATLLSGLITTGLVALLAPRGIPVLILPFNLTVILMLYAMRQRVEDRAPKSVDFLLGSPEQNLAFFRTRLARFGARHWVRFRAPFLGSWICTQGVDGEISHGGPWRHGFDFEVCDAAGQTARGAGAELTDYHCYRMPVLAAADGTVAALDDGVPDNRVGELNLRQNWGNYVLLQHAPGLYSMYAHLAPGSLDVREGQVVRQGDPVGRCGNSGRSAVPHLHYQLQRTARAGDATIPAELHEVIVTQEGEEHLHATLVPEEGDVVRSIAPDDDVAALFELPFREVMTFEITVEGRTARERIEPDIDLYGNLLVRSLDRRAHLYYDHRDDVFLVYDTLGSPRSVLHLLHAALSRVPFEIATTLTWSDHLSRRALTPWYLRPLTDLASPFLGAGGEPIRYRAARRGPVLEIEGATRRGTRAGDPLLATRATLSAAHGILRLEVATRGRSVVARRLDEEGAPLEALEPDGGAEAPAQADR